MGAVLFVHHDLGFRDRIKTESKDFTGTSFILASSLRDSIDSITNPALSLSAIFISVKNLDFSLFRALNLALNQRPVTPVFLLDQESHPTLKNFHVFSAYASDTPLKDLFVHLNTQQRVAPDSAGRAHGHRHEPGFISVPASDFLNLIHYPEDVFIYQREGQMKLFAAANSEVDLPYLHQVVRQSAWLYIREDSFQATREQLQSGLLKYQDLPGISEEWKRSELLSEARTLLEELRTELPSDPVLERSVHFLGNLFRTITDLTQAEDATRLTEFIKEASKNDRMISTLALSMILCGFFKYEKTSVVEVLGLSSLLSDISLIHSPFGDLTKTNPESLSFEAKTYYRNHPSLSADLLQNTTALPPVVLQVIRQHHEAKDRTGYPSRIGGFQLHPLAEALSILGHLIELREAQLSPLEIRAHLRAKVYPHYSSEAVSALDRVLIRVFPSIPGQA